MSRSLLKLLVLSVLVATLTALGVSLAFAEIDTGTGGGDPVATLPPVIFLSSPANGKVDDLKFKDEDIIMFVPDDETGTSGTWSMFFDGSDVGVSNTDIDAFELLDDSTLLVSFDRPVRIPGLGRVDDSDILQFDMTLSGQTTAGSFSVCFDGSEFDLTSGAEDIDAIAFDEAGRLLISTLGTARANGRDLRARDEDLLAFSTTPFDCNPASGTWEIFVDGSDLALTKGSEDIGGAWVDTSVSENNIYLSAKGRFRAADGVNGVDGDGDDIFGLTPFTLGEENTTGFLFAAFDGDIVGHRRPIDGIFIAPASTALIQAAAVAEDVDDESIVQFVVEEDDLTEDDITDLELDVYDSTADPLIEEDIVSTLYMPMVIQR